MKLRLVPADPVGRVSAAPARRARLVLPGALLALALAPAAAGGESATAVVNTLPQVLSVTVSTDQLTYAGCTGGSSTSVTLGFPNGRCTAGPVTIQNGGVTAFIFLFGTPAAPSDGGTPWRLCDGLTIDCTGADASTPGQDEFLQATSNQADPSGQEFPVPAQGGGCDFAFGCRVPPGAPATELLHLLGPSASTDPSPQFSSTLTWTASLFGI